MRSSTQPKVVVITGASAGVGRATVRAFAEQGGREGIKIGLIARGREGLAAARAEVEAAGGEALELPTDVADAKQVEQAAAQVEERFGPPDIWVNDAMASVFGPIHEIAPEDFKRVTEVTYLGTVYGTMAALRRMRPRRHGVIIQVGSALARRGIPLQGAYCGAKHAIQGFTESLRCELLHERTPVRVTIVHMPALNTPQFDWSKNLMAHKTQPVPPIFQPEVAAAAILFAASHNRRQIFVGGSTVEAVQANKVVPGWLDHYLARTGYESQQTPELENPNRPNNLWKPVEGDFGAHGRFDDKASPTSGELWFATHRPTGLQLVTAAAVAGAAALVAHRFNKAA